jgi:hypothetical protein
MSDFIPDIADTLFVWQCLTQAKEGTNPYGRTVAEVYVEHLIPRQVPTNDRQVWVEAGKNLHGIIRDFCNINHVSASVNGVEVGDWLDGFELRHKCDVRIYERPRKRRRR